jgi:hypothetical protein
MDCDDLDPSIHPGAPDRCGDGIDSDCDGMDPACACPQDRDRDGRDVPECGGCDCDDTDPAIHCGAAETCGDGIDQDCSGADLACACPVDADRDGSDVPECGGCDCNDGDPTIECGIPETCDATPALCDDGIDQNCDGSDCTCFILFSAPAPRDAWSLVPWARSTLDSERLVSIAPGPWTLPDWGPRESVATQPVYLIAVAGDDQYADVAGTGNVGLTTFEVTRISTAPDATNGSLLGWTVQTQQLPLGRRTHGLDALLYFDYLFTFSAVDSEVRSTSTVNVQVSAAARFPYAEDAAAAAVIERFESTSTSFVTSRAYYSLARVNGAVFLVGGRNASGPVSTIERTIP